MTYQHMDILQKVLIKERLKPNNFLRFVSAKQKKELLGYAARMRGKRVVHVNATEIGGGVAEIMKSLVPYLRSLGVQSDWYVISPGAGNKFFSFTNKLHNALQGAPVKFSAKEWGEYEAVNKRIAAALDAIDCDALVIHDPQPLLAGSLAHLNKHKIYFSHIDTSSAHMPVWKKVLPLVNSYHRIVFSNRNFVHGSLPKEKVRVFTPAIDPLSPKQRLVSKKEAREYLEKHGGIPPGVPLVVQVSRFDVWKNPLGVIQAFRLLQSTYPDAHLALVGFNEAKDNPAADVVYKDVAAVAAKSKNIHLFFNARGKNIREFTVMAQNGADVVVQNSIKEGFGLVVAEAMWKRQPVIGGPADGIRKQIANEKNGFIVHAPEQLAEKMRYLFSHPKQKKKMGEAARNTVLRKFLFPRLVLDHLKLYLSCVK